MDLDFLALFWYYVKLGDAQYYNFDRFNLDYNAVVGRVFLVLFMPITTISFGEKIEVVVLGMIGFDRG